MLACLHLHASGQVDAKAVPWGNSNTPPHHRLGGGFNVVSYGLGGFSTRCPQSRSAGVLHGVRFCSHGELEERALTNLGTLLWAVHSGKECGVGILAPV